MSDQTDIIMALGVAAEFNAAGEARRRVDFLKDYRESPEDGIFFSFASKSPTRSSAAGS